jgi:hypothetical protein
MTWTSFTIAVMVCYALYYGGNILFDLIRPASIGKSGVQTEVLHFTEETRPVVVTESDEDDEPFTPQRSEKKTGKQEVAVGHREASPQSEITPDPLSGGLSISQLMPAIRQKAIVMTTRHDFERHSF